MPTDMVSAARLEDSRDSRSGLVLKVNMFRKTIALWCAITQKTKNDVNTLTSDLVFFTTYLCGPVINSLD